MVDVGASEVVVVASVLGNGAAEGGDGAAEVVNGASEVVVGAAEVGVTVVDSVVVDMVVVVGYKGLKGKQFHQGKLGTGLPVSGSTSTTGMPSVPQIVVFTFWVVDVGASVVTNEGVSVVDVDSALTTSEGASVDSSSDFVQQIPYI